MWDGSGDVVRAATALAARLPGSVAGAGHAGVQLSVVLDGPGAAPRTRYQKGPDLLAFFAWLRRELPQFTIAEDRLTETTRGAVVEWEASGTSARGDRFEAMGTMVMEADGGRISSLRVYPDTAALNRALGLSGDGRLRRTA